MIVYLFVLLEIWIGQVWSQTTLVELIFVEIDCLWNLMILVVFIDFVMFVQ